MRGIPRGKLLAVCLSVLAVNGLLSAGTADALWTTYPGYPTLQDAVDAAQGTPDPKVTINTDGPITGSIVVTGSLTIEAGATFTPTIRGASGSGSTLYFHPNSAGATSLTLRGLTVVPAADAAPGSGRNVIDVLNDGAGTATFVIDRLTLSDPGNAGPTGINIRSGMSGGPNNVAVGNSTVTLGGSPGYGATAFSMAGSGTLAVSGSTVNMSGSSGDGFDIRGSAGSGIVFTLSNSTFNPRRPPAATRSRRGGSRTTSPPSSRATPSTWRPTPWDPPPGSSPGGGART
jgi:hypothetical protein